MTLPCIAVQPLAKPKIQTLNRSVHEVLYATKRSVAQEYHGASRRMNAEAVALEDLLRAREQMMMELQQGLYAAEPKFRVSLARKEPEWSQLNISHLAELPAIRWKLQNVG